MNIRLDNFLLFRNFSLNLAYPKKIVGSTVENEYLAGRPSFRYRKVVVMTGANATGKTALGKILMKIFNFISSREASGLFRMIDNHTLPASFSVDLAFSDFRLFRVSAEIRPKKNSNDEYTGEDLQVNVRSVYIRTGDSYETCAARLEKVEPVPADHYTQALEAVPYLTWLFEYPFASEGKQRAIRPADPHVYSNTLYSILKVLDPRIVDIREITPSENTYQIIYPNSTVLIKDGLVLEPEKLSSGTIEGIGIAQLITGIRIHSNDFFYCDEKFSHIHSDAEKAFLSLMIELLGPNQQLFFTTHNPDILDMNLPKHSFVFLRREISPDHRVSCVYASDYLKKETVSLRNAVENDLFSAAPDVSGIFQLAEDRRIPS